MSNGPEKNGQQLTLEQKATNYDTMRHIRTVGHFVNRFIHALIERAAEHDESKLASPEVEYFTEYTPKLAASSYGSAEYEGFRAAMEPALEHHYSNNAHHPEFQRRNEIWHAVAGFESHYQVSSFGDVRSVDREVKRNGPTGNLIKRGQILKQCITPKGYCRVQLCADGKTSNVMVHRLVAEAFIANPENKPEVNHKDGDKRNNCVSNLEWVTPSENQLHAYATGLKQSNVKYVVHCDELDITTFGCERMEKELHLHGYENASSAAIWKCINHGGKHLDLTFTGSNLEGWENSPISDMTLIDLVEMFCDWKAATLRHHNGNLLKSIEINSERFSISPQVRKILENTARLFD